jgi:predicted DNA-binding transcriptional regulator AlpA
MRSTSKHTPTTETPTPLTPLLDDHATAPLLGVSPATLRKSRVTGTLLGLPTPNFLKIAKTIRYRESDIREWLSQLSCFGNTAEAKQATNDFQVKGVK